MSTIYISDSEVEKQGRQRKWHIQKQLP